MIWLIPSLYVLGFGVTWIAAARYWLRRFPPRGEFDFIEAGMWAFLVSIFWPLVAAGWSVGRVASRV